MRLKNIRKRNNLACWFCSRKTECKWWRAVLSDISMHLKVFLHTTESVSSFDDWLQKKTSEWVGTLYDFESRVIYRHGHSISFFWDKAKHIRVCNLRVTHKFEACKGMNSWLCIDTDYEVHRLTHQSLTLPSVKKWNWCYKRPTEAALTQTALVRII